MDSRRNWPFLLALALMAALAPAALGADGLETIASPTHECITRNIRCGDTVPSSLDATECFYDEEAYADQWNLAVTAGQEITVTLTSSVFEPKIVLFSPQPALALEQDGAGGTSTIQTTLTTSGNWRIAATSVNAHTTGAYTLTVACSTPALPPGPFLTSAEFPDFRFKVRITSERVITGVQEADCQPDTLCVSGALPGRPEVFIRIVGPRGNGLLWPNIIKFSTSQIEVWIEQISTGVLKYYVLPGANPTSSDLPGLFDRNGFVP